MADAAGSTATLRLGAVLADGRDVELSASGTVITFRGFLAAYEEGRDEERAAADEAREEDRRLPQMAVGDAGRHARRSTADGHETSPPPRFTEATLVKALEERGIGRPSTYAATIGTIVDRGYVRRRGSALVPTWLAFAVTRLLERHFPRLVDYDFTAGMEEDLDRIAGGEQNRVEWLRKFYFGDGTHVAGYNGAGTPGRRGPARPGRRPRRHRRPRHLDGAARRGPGPAGRPLRPVRRVDAAAGAGREPAPRNGSGRHRTGRADPGQGPRAARGDGRRRSGARQRPGHRPRDHRQGRPLRPLCHRGDPGRPSPPAVVDLESVEATRRRRRRRRGRRQGQAEEEGGQEGASAAQSPAPQAFSPTWRSTP